MKYELFYSKTLIYLPNSMNSQKQWNSYGLQQITTLFISNSVNIAKNEEYCYLADVMISQISNKIPGCDEYQQKCIATISSAMLLM